MPLRLHKEILADGHTWWRIADPAWQDPLDPRYAGRVGGRWNPPDSFPTLYLNHDKVTARLNLRRFIAQWPYEPEDLRNDSGPVLVGAQLPRGQQVCDCHSRQGIAAAGLPATFPLDAKAHPVAHAVCQPVGAAAKAQRLRGVYARSAQSPDGAGRELAWFPVTRRSVARQVDHLAFEAWFWG